MRRVPEDRAEEMTPIGPWSALRTSYRSGWCGRARTETAKAIATR